jgi:hypothetical protein
MFCDRPWTQVKTVVNSDALASATRLDSRGNALLSLLTHRVSSLQSSHSVAFGVKRTSAVGTTRSRGFGSEVRMTNSRQ